MFSFQGLSKGQKLLINHSIIRKTIIVTGEFISFSHYIVLVQFPVEYTARNSADSLKSYSHGHVYQGDIIVLIGQFYCLTSDCDKWSYKEMGIDEMASTTIKGI